MCGVCGFWSRGEALNRGGRGLLREMARQLEHRGPDAEGTWHDERRGVGFGHRRLSILDLSTQGRQPMHSRDGRWVVSYNGEIYNYEELASELGLERRRGHSDTEVLVEALSRWGPRETVGRLVGMFAFAAWDDERGELHLVRDRLGIKPLFWGVFAGGVVFGSELRVFGTVPDFPLELDREALTGYLRFGVFSGEASVWRAVHRVEPGRILTFSRPQGAPAEHRYWRAEEVAAIGASARFGGSDEEAVDLVDDLARDSVRRRMVADVPLGAFLSGGVDSATVVALMQAQSSRPVQTFSIGFEEAAYDESADARAVAAHLGTDHTEMIVSSQQCLELVGSLATMFDEPFADSSQIPTHLVSRLARNEVSVALSGDGGDELFAGYNRHVWGPRVWAAASKIPYSVRRAGVVALRQVPFDAWESVLSDAVSVRLPAEKLQKLMRSFPARDFESLYTDLRAFWPDAASVVVGGGAGALALPAGRGEPAEQMMLWDLVSYLPDDILTKVDRASMAVSLEARVPMLDHRLVELAWRLPMTMKLREGSTKWILRQVLYRYVPRELVERPKMGFGVPVDQWLRGPLRSWADDLLDPGQLTRDGIFRADAIRAAWEDHQSGRRARHHELWAILMFQQWWAQHGN